MFFVIMALTNPGDEVIYPNPGFPIYESVINFVGGKPVPIPLLEETRLPLRPARSSSGASRRRRKLIIINSPENPTGGVLSPEDVGRIADARRGTTSVPVLSDEIYRRFLYDGEFASIATLPGMKPQTIILDGFSKTYAMTGWRLGFGVMPKPLAEHVTRLMTNSVVLHRDLHPARRPRRAHGPTTRRCRRWSRSSASGAT